MWSWRTLAIAYTVALAAAGIAWIYRDDLRAITQPVVSQIASLFSSDATTGRRTYRTKDDIGRSEESQVTGVMDRAVALATGASTSNFQEVRALDASMSLSRLSRSVGMLIFTDEIRPGDTQSYSCTGFMISPRYVMTAAHCFFRDPDSSKWSKPANVVALEFVPGYEQPGRLGSALHLKIKQRREGKRSLFWKELACREDPCSLKGDEVDGYDFAILELADDAEAQLKAYNEGRPENEKVVLGTAILGDVGLGPQQQLVIFHHPGGGQMMFVERHCLTPATRANAEPTRTFFKHFCDTLDGSSGAPVFSRDHEVVVGLHVQGSRPFTAAERSGQTRANGSVHIRQIVAISKVVGEHVTVVVDPPTSEQRELIDFANARGEEASRFIEDGRFTLAAHLALDGLEHLTGRNRADEAFLLERAHRAHSMLADALWRRTELAALKSHHFYVTSASFSPDGTRVVSSAWGAGGAAHVWDAKTGILIITLRHAYHVSSAAFAPDGKRIVTGSDDRTAQVWDAESGAMLLTLKGHDGPVTSAAFSPDGSRVVTGSSDKTALVWDAKSGVRLLGLKGHEGVVTSAAFSRDGSRVVTASDDKTARVWDATTGAYLLGFKHEDRVNSAAFSPDGSRVVTGSNDRTARVWNAKNGAELLALKSGFNWVEAVAFSPDGRRVASGSSDNTVRLWDATSGDLMLALKGHADAVTSVAFSPDGARVVTGSRDGTTRLWDTGSPRPALILAEHLGPVRCSVFSPDGKRIATGCWGNAIQLWDAESGAPIRAFDGTLAVAFSPDGKRVVTGGNTARVWDAKSGVLLVTLKGHESAVVSAEFSSNGVRIVTGSDDTTARVWNAADGKQILSLKGHRGNVLDATFSPDGARVVTSSSDRTARVWDVRTGAELTALEGHEGAVGSVDFSPDGARIVTGSNDNTARIWDGATGVSLAVLRGHEDRVTSVSFSPDGQSILTASFDRSVRIWSANRGLQRVALRGYGDPVLSASFSPDGKRIVTGSADARVWRLWPSGSEFVGEAYCRLRLLKPSKDECRAYNLDCVRPRAPLQTCDPTLALTK